jgi:AraC-like DNA-binding protein
MKKIPIRNIKTTLKEPNFSESFNIRDVSALLSGKDMDQELHRHDFFFILALQKGVGTHTIDFTSHEIGDNSVFFLRPGQVHQLTLKAGSTGYLMEFKTEFYHPHDIVSHQLLRQASAKNICQPEAERFKKIFAALTYTYHEYTEKKERYQEVIKANLSIFFIELVRSRQSLNSQTNQTTSYSQERLDNFLELLETQIAEHKNVSHYAGELNLSPFQLNAITKATLGKTSSEIINDYIILEIKRYLLATSNQISQVAYHLGYEDVSYFIRFFRKHTGYSPETFRRTFSKSH